MPGDEADRMGMVAVRQRNPKSRSGRKRCRYAGDHVDSDSVLFKFYDFFARAPEDHRITRLQTHDMPALSRQLDHEFVDVFLSAAFAPAALAHHHAFGLAAREFKDFRGDKVIIEDDIGRL